MLPLALGEPLSVAAQDVPSSQLPPPLTLTYVEGRAELARFDGVTPARAPDVVDDGDRLITFDGRAELVHANGTLVHMDRDSDLRVEGDRLRVVRGRVVVRTAAAAEPLELALPVGDLRLSSGGEYEIAARDLDGASVVATLVGRATLALAASDVPIAAGDQVWIDPRGLEPRWSRAAPARDEFTDWAVRRVNAMAAAQRSQPLPVELTAYAPGFAAYGQWDTLPTYGPVWFPTATPGWRPYADGRWRYTRHGWTWIDVAPWGWPVHHYGRWGRHHKRGWYWMPHRTWAPAWVGWAVQANYIGWAPLGWNSLPVVDFFVGARVGPVGVWAGSWSVVPRYAFGGHGPIGRHFADLRHLPGPVLGGFVAQRHGPRGPAGWDRRVASAYGYGRPTAAGRWGPADLDGGFARGAQSAARAVPRGAGRSPGSLRASRSAGGGASVTPAPPVERRGPRGLRGSSRLDDTAAIDARPPQPRDAGRQRREVAPEARIEPRRIERRPIEARPRNSGRADRAATAPAESRRVYGRPSAAPGSGWGRPDAASARARSAGNARGGGNAGGNARSTAVTGARRGGQSGSRGRPG